MLFPNLEKLENLRKTASAPTPHLYPLILQQLMESQLRPIILHQSKICFFVFLTTEVSQRMQPGFDHIHSEYKLFLTTSPTQDYHYETSGTHFIDKLYGEGGEIQAVIKRDININILIMKRL